MFETLTKGFRSATQRLRGIQELSEENIEQALRDVRLSLLEADVEFSVTKSFLNRVKEKALGEMVTLRVKHGEKKVKVTPGDHFIKICQEELEAIMGPVDSTLQFSRNPARPTCVMMVGLQGSGKTTTAAKLARLMQSQGRTPLMVAADIYRPAAILQLQRLGESLTCPVYKEDSKDPPAICEHSLAYASKIKHDVIIMDTAGRLAIDDALMKELQEIKRRVKPENIFLVCDAMIGADAVRTAKEFDERLNLDGIILTKLDGDARGGAALSIKAVTGKPIKFLGMGESLDRLEEFRPDGMASRILGMGDIIGLMQDFESVVDQQKAEEDAQKLLQGNFHLGDFLEQIKTLQKIGPFSELLEKLPIFADGMPEGFQVNEKEFVKIESMIHSMTPDERCNPQLINESRAKRIARGSGRDPKDVQELLMKFKTMRAIMGTISENPSWLGRIPGIKQLEQIRRLRGMDMSDIFGVSSVDEASAPMPMAAPGMANPFEHFRQGKPQVAKDKDKRKRKQARKDRKKAKKKR